VLPVVVEIVLIQKAFTKTKTELGQSNVLWVIGEREAPLVRNAVIFAVDVKTMQVGITPTHGNLNRVVKIGDAVVIPQEQSPPDHWANATQNHLELVNAETSRGPASKPYCIATDQTAKSFPQFGGRTSTRIFVLS
jgi:hypothetical protein